MDRRSWSRGTVRTPQQASTGTLDVLSQIGKALTNASLYGPTHRLTEQAVSSGYGVVRRVLEQVKRIDLAMVEGELHVNDTSVGARNPLAMTLASRMGALDISAFSLVAGMSETEFRDLIDLLLSLPSSAGEDKFAESVKRRNLQHVKANTGDYRRVGESEVVIEVDELRARQSGGGQSGRGLFDLDGEFGGSRDCDARSEAASRPVEPPASPETILAFLKGEAGTNADAVDEGLADMVSDADKLGSLILEAAMVRQRNCAFGEGESLADLVVGCLRRTYEGLSRRRDASDPEAKQDLKRGLILLEKTVLDRLHAMVEGLEAADGELPWQDDASPDDEETVEALATEYVRRRDALRRTEEKLMGQLRQGTARDEQGWAVQEQLARAGMPSTGWNELAAKAGGSAGGGSAGDASGGLGVLAALLTQLDSLMGGEAAGGTARLAAEIGGEVDAIAQGTEAKIAALASGTRDAGGRKTSVTEEDGMDRQLLAEITQELCQPATVMSCAVATIVGEYLGPVTAEQQELLELAVGCGDRLAGLLDRLRDAVGIPVSLTPA